MNHYYTLLTYEICCRRCQADRSFLCFSKKIGKAEPRKMIPLSEEKPYEILWHHMLNLPQWNANRQILPVLRAWSMIRKTNCSVYVYGRRYSTSWRKFCWSESIESTLSAVKRRPSFNKGESTSKIPSPQNGSRIPLPYQYQDEYGHCDYFETRCHR
jgi:hypothetical protein